MIMYSGNSISVVGGDAPLLSDIAIHIGREGRFANGCRFWWTCLHHSFVVETICMDMLQDKRKCYTLSVRPYALLHDAHECVTRDIPTPFKPDEMRLIQADLDRRIFASHGLPMPLASYEKVIKTADRRAMIAEGLVAGPPGWIAAYEADAGPLSFWDRHNMEHDAHIVRNIHATYPNPHFSFEPDSLGVRDYIEAVEEAVLAAR